MSDKLKPENVMRALELHADCETDNCFECPYEKYLSKEDGNCVHHLSMDALALLREKDAKCADYIRQIADMQAKFATKDSELTAMMQHKKIEADKDAEIERLKIVTNDQYAHLCDVHDKVAEMLRTARAEAITEFAERLKEYLDDFYAADENGLLDVPDLIDQIAKEMKEAADGSD